VLLSGLSQQRKIQPISAVLVWQSLPAMLAGRASAQHYRINLRAVFGGKPANDLVVFRGQ
jgi:hypothetical protein